MCGADFPLKVSALGESSALGYVDEPIRPPGVDRRREPSGAAAALADLADRHIAPPPPRYSPPSQPGAPMSIEPPGVAQPKLSAAAGARRAAVQSAGAAGLAAQRPASRRYSPAPTTPLPLRRSRRSTPRSCRPTRGPAPRRSGRRNPRDRAPACRRSARRAIRSLPPRTPVEVKPAATLACPIVSALDRWIANAVQPAAQQVVQPAGGRDQADLGLFLPRHERPGRRAHLRARLRQCARHRGLRAGRRPPHHGQGRLERLAGGAGLPARRAGARPATSSPPCWRRARTSSTTTTSTST